MNQSAVAVQPDGSLTVESALPELDVAGARRRLHPVVVAAITVLAAVFVFASYDLYLCLESTLYLNKKLLQGASILPNYFSWFDYIVIAVSLLLLERFGVRFFRTRFILRVLFVFAATCVILDLLNPNDESPKLLGLPLMALPNIKAYVFLLFMFALFFMREEGFLITVRRMAWITGALVLGRTIILLILWAMGGGNYKFGGMGSTLTEGDSLMVFAFFSVLFLALFFIRRRFFYLAGWVLLTALQVLSFRRSALYVVLGSNAFVLLLHLLVRNRVGTILRNFAVMAFVAVVGVLVIIQTIPEDTVQYYFNRYFGIFLGMGQSEQDAYAGDSGHFNESATTLAYAMDKMDFWGYGGGTEDRINIPGATQRLWVHNVYAGAWLYHGVYQFVFYLLLFCMMTLMAMKIFFQRHRYDERFVLLMGSFVGVMVMMMIIWYTNPIQIAESLKMRIYWVTLVACIFRITPANFHVMLGEQPAPLEIEPDQATAS